MLPQELFRKQSVYRGIIERPCITPSADQIGCRARGGHRLTAGE